jgi:hypothetical protein
MTSSPITLPLGLGRGAAYPLVLERLDRQHAGSLEG